MTKVTAETLSAHHDQELGLDQSERLRQELAEDGEARTVLDAYARVDDAVRASHAGELEAPESLALARSVRSAFAARRRWAVGRVVLHWAGPVAAAIAIIALGNHWIEQRATSALAEHEARIAALTDRVVQDALENAVSGAKVSMVDETLAGEVSVTPIRTFRSETQHWCREFVENVVVEDRQSQRYGLACREDSGGWRRIETRLPGSRPPPVGSVL